MYSFQEKGFQFDVGPTIVMKAAKIAVDRIIKDFQS